MQNPKSRRQTLGGISVNHGNSRRKSVDPGSAGNGGGPPKPRIPRGRASMIPRVGRENMVPPTPPSSKARHAPVSTGRKSVGGDRRQSVIPPSAPARSDPRPIADKAFQQECVKKLHRFLVDRNYDHPISPKSLARPSGKDFTQIVTFLLRRVDANFQDGSMKLEDEIAMNFRAMGYPFPVSKTSLVTAGSPHAWPALLAALTWLTERIDGLDSCAAEDDDPGQFASLEELEAKTDKAFFKYLGAAYTAFLQGDEQESEKLENALFDRFARDDGIIEQEIERMTDTNASIVEQINNLSLGEQDLQDYTTKREGYATDLQQMHDLIEQLDQHVATLKQKKKERDQELQETNRMLDRTNTHIEQLKEDVDNQALSMEDVQKMQNELKGIAEAIDRTVTQKNERRDILWGGKSEIDKLWTLVEASVTKYNSRLSELGLLPLLSASTAQMKATATKDTAPGDDQSKVIGVNLLSEAQPSLLQGKQEYAEKLSESKWRYQEALDQLERSEEGFTESLERLKIVENKMDKCEEMLAAEKDAQEAKLGVRLREAESLESRIASLRDPVVLEEKLALYERQCAELESLRMKYQEEHSARKNAVCVEIERACHEMDQYDKYCAETIAEVQAYRNEKREMYGKLQKPSSLQ